MKSITLGVRAATAAALCVASLAGMASDYPGKPVRMVVAAPAAGAVDLMGRISCE
jgi:tripartite-type tricarboxylate transporter receptor subunit TctC